LRWLGVSNARFDRRWMQYVGAPDSRIRHAKQTWEVARRRRIMHGNKDRPGTSPPAEPCRTNQRFSTKRAYSLDPTRPSPSRQMYDAPQSAHRCRVMPVDHADHRHRRRRPSPVGPNDNLHLTHATLGTRCRLAPVPPSAAGCRPGARCNGDVGQPPRWGVAQRAGERVVNLYRHREHGRGGRLLLACSTTASESHDHHDHSAHSHRPLNHEVMVPSPGGADHP
jgi:hypothetical protein